MDNLEYKNLEEKKQHGTFEKPIAIYNGDVKPGDDKYAHWHREMEINYVESGNGEVVIDQNRFKISGGDIIIVPRNSIHYIIANPDSIIKAQSIVFNIELMANLSYDYCQSEFIYPVLTKGVDVTNVIHLNSKGYDEILFCVKSIIESEKEKEYAYELQTKSLFYQFFFKMFSYGYLSIIKEKNVKKLQKQNAIKNVITFINENYNKNFTTADLAKIAEYSEFHFIRSFKEQTGKTCKEYINAVRLEKAVYFLESTKMPITDISSEAGYNDLSYFIKIFKKKFGISPNRFRRKK